MRLVTGTIDHESNVFSSLKTDVKDFQEVGIYHGSEALEHFRGTRTEMGAYIDECARLKIELIPTVCNEGIAAGLITHNAFDALLKELLDGVREAYPFDGVVLHLHGAGVAEGCDDIEGKIISDVRELVGSVPIVSTQDYHANYTKQMFENCDVLIGQDTYPHTDMYDRGVEAIHVIKQLVEGKLKPTKAFRHPPMLLAPQVQFTGRCPMSKLIDAAHELEALPGVITITVGAGFPWSDVADAGLTFLVYTNDDQKQADKLANELSELAWNMRKEFLTHPVPIVEAIRRVREAEEGPIVLADIGDNPGAGTSGDGTIALRAVLDSKLENGVLAFMADPEAVAKAIEAGVGRNVTLELGGKTDNLHGTPLKVTAYVKTISDGKYLWKGPIQTGLENDQGRTVVLRIDGVEVIVTEKRNQPLDLEPYRTLGIEPTEKKFILVKSSVHYRGGHEAIAKEIIELDTPGLSSPRLETFNFRKIKRPIFPLDKELDNSP